jgi:hypothetical protein
MSHLCICDCINWILGHSVRGSFAGAAAFQRVTKVNEEYLTWV